MTSAEIRARSIARAAGIAGVADGGERELHLRLRPLRGRRILAQAPVGQGVIGGIETVLVRRLQARDRRRSRPASRRRPGPRQRALGFRVIGGERLAILAAHAHLAHGGIVRETGPRRPARRRSACIRAVTGAASGSGYRWRGPASDRPHRWRREPVRCSRDRGGGHARRRGRLDDVVEGGLRRSSGQNGRGRILRGGCRHLPRGRRAEGGRPTQSNRSQMAALRKSRMTCSSSQ